jgi:iron complex transport system substrate-binding protein
MMGRSVTLDAKPTNIVSLSPTAIEMLYAIGGTAVGRDSASKYPPEVLDLPEVGGAYSPSAEAIAALSPDLILIEVLTQSRMIQALEAVNFPIIAVQATSLEDVIQSMELLGSALDLTDGATTAIGGIQTRISGSKVERDETINVLILISDADRNVYAAKPESFPGAVAAIHGLTNLAAGLPDSGPFPGFTLLSPEQALTGEPDIVFTISPAPPPVPSLSSMLPRVPGFGSLAAIQEGRVREIDPVVFLQSPGPRIVDAVEEMSRHIKEVLP